MFRVILLKISPVWPKKRGPGASRGGRACRGQGYPAGETGILHLLKGG